MRLEQYEPETKHKLRFPAYKFLFKDTIAL